MRITGTKPPYRINITYHPVGMRLIASTPRSQINATHHPVGTRLIASTPTHRWVSDRGGRDQARPYKKTALTALLIACLLFLPACNASPLKNTSSGNGELTSYVNPFIGTAHIANGDGGNTIPGAFYPAGMVQWSPDTPTRIPGGYYYPDTSIQGFSLTHFSGRGCTAYQDFPFMPYVGQLTVSPVSDSIHYHSRFSHSSESAHPGYYRVHLDSSSVDVELTVTPRTGMGRFTYPSTSSATMLISSGASVNGILAAGVTILPASNEVKGFATSTVGCGTQHYTVYFAARFDRPFNSYGTWDESTLNQGSTSDTGKHNGAFVTFDTSSQHVVQVQVGISFTNLANAEANLKAEDAHFDFDHALQQADAAWNARLNAIQVQGGTTAEKTIFYTALYHSFLHPNIFNDANGQYLGFDDRVHSLAPGQHAQYENITGWDHYRSLIYLLAILVPQEASDIAQSLVNDAMQGDGHIPRWVQANVDSHGMNGDGGSAIIASAYAFGATGFNTRDALFAMINGQPNLREGLSDYLRLGYVAAGTTGNSAAVTLEYAAADFAIAQFAKSLGDTHNYAMLIQRAYNWRKLFNPASGYIQPRNSDGTWVANFSLTSDNGFQEGDSAQYTWMVPFDLRTLFRLMGGNARAVQRLDTFFTKLNDGPQSLYAYMGNEPGFVVPWEYDFAGAPSYTQSVVRRIQLQLFKDTPNGLPGNDDGGAMSSWYIFSTLGLYPEIPGVGGFVLGSPLFSSMTVQLGNGKTLQIHAPNAADGKPFVQHLQINGSDTQNLWLPWSTVAKGVQLDFDLGSNATGWGNGSRLP